LAALKVNMGAAWRETVVVLVTELGRTARINGSKGTDHGAVLDCFVASLLGRKWVASAVVTSSSADTFIQQDRPAAGPQLAMTID
jgi:hypothetical protein